ncbi:MAG: hypothetical protein PVF24_03055, partial [Desulfobacterales bacterium]
TAAVSADVLSSIIGQKNEDIFVTALFQDIGILILKTPVEIRSVLLTLPLSLNGDLIMKDN